jgi:ribosomal protein S18 acetylase RimI-like enzyme
MAIEIRAATAEDYDDLCALSDQVDALHRENLPLLFQRPGGPSRDKDYILSLLADRSMSLFVAEAAGVAIGYVHAEICESPLVPIFVPRRYAAVHDLVVDYRFRQTGVGRSLMERVHRWAAAQGVTEVELTVFKFNETAQAFYESLGYEVLSKRMHIRLKQDPS